MSKFSLTEFFTICEKYPEHRVMSAVAEEYSDRRGLFNSKFIPFDGIQLLGYAGLKRMLISICETDESFIEQNKGELQNIISTLRGDN